MTPNPGAGEIGPYADDWGVDLLDLTPDDPQLHTANLAAGWVLLRHNLPMRSLHSGNALTGLWDDLDAVLSLPTPTLLWLHDLYTPALNEHQGVLDPLLDDADQHRRRRRPAQPQVDRDDPADVTNALADLFVRTSCYVKPRASTTEKALFDAHTSWAADHWMTTPTRTDVINALLLASNAHRTTDGRIARIQGLSPHPHRPAGPRSVTNEHLLDDIARRMEDSLSSYHMAERLGARLQHRLPRTDQHNHQ